MIKKLEMVFKNSNNSNVTLSVEDPRDDINSTEVQAAMNDIVGKNVFESKTGKVVSVSSARIITTEVTELEV